MAKKDVWIYAEWNKHSKEFSYYVRGYACDLTSGEVLLEKRTLTFNTPSDFELRRQVSLALKVKRQKVIADAHVEAMEIDQTIQELLAIEDKSNENTSSF